MRKSTMLCALAVALVALTGGLAMAEVQNIKVSGDLSAQSFFRKDFGMGSGGILSPATNAFVSYGVDDQQFQQMLTRIRVDADLTDNVSTSVRLAHERRFGRNGSFDVGVDLASVTLKEFFYQPLTLTIGRQPLWFGKGFIVGTNAASWNPEAALFAPEYSTYNNFDAVRATLDYAPWTIDGIAATIGDAATPSLNDNWLLYGINVGYKFDHHNAETELYWFNTWRDSNPAPVAFVAGTPQTDAVATLVGGAGVNAGAGPDAEPRTTKTIGLRGSFDPWQNWNLWGEGAVQFGKYNRIDDTNFLFSFPAATTSILSGNRGRRAFAFDVGFENKIPSWTWQPSWGAEWIFYSGDSSPFDGTSGNYTGWDPVFRGKFDSAIRDFQGVSYLTGNPFDQGGYTNEHQLAFFTKMKPMDGMELQFRYTDFLAAKTLSRYNISGAGSDPTAIGATMSDTHIGDEFDAKLTYDYTEDVQFGLLWGFFVPGKFYEATGTASPTGNTTDVISDSRASTVVGSVKVTF